MGFLQSCGIFFPVRQLDINNATYFDTYATKLVPIWSVAYMNIMRDVLEKGVFFIRFQGDRIYLPNATTSNEIMKKPSM